MHYLVDGYNLLFFLKKSDPFQKNRDFLIDSLNELAKNQRSAITLVFDGDYEWGDQSGLAYFSHLLVAFSPKNQTADEYILEKISYSSTPSLYTVVSEDQGLLRSAKSLSARTKSIESFLHWLKKCNKTSDEEKPQKENEIHLERLRKIFEKRLQDPDT